MNFDNFKANRYLTEVQKAEKKGERVEVKEMSDNTLILLKRKQEVLLKVNGKCKRGLGILE